MSRRALNAWTKAALIAALSLTACARAPRQGPPSLLLNATYFIQSLSE